MDWYTTTMDVLYCKAESKEAAVVDRWMDGWIYYGLFSNVFFYFAFFTQRQEWRWETNITDIENAYLVNEYLRAKKYKKLKNIELKLWGFVHIHSEQYLSMKMYGEIYLLLPLLLPLTRNEAAVVITSFTFKNVEKIL